MTGPVYDIVPLGDETQWSFVAATYRDSLYHDGDMYWIPGRVFHEEAGRRLRYMREHGTIVVAVGEDRNVFFGWCAYTDDHLHYVYVKQPYRRCGIASALANKAGHVATHWTRGMMHWGEGLSYTAVFWKGLNRPARQKGNH